MSAQGEFSSFKLLLKQVYSAHSSKVKELENEIKFLKEKLDEKERNSNTNVGDCKRCIELEAAFKTCKKALHEQSKLFENFGQKFSIFNSADMENNELKNTTSSSCCALESSVSSNNLKNLTLCDKIESLQEKDTLMQDNENKAEKLSVSPNNKNLLSKVLLDDCETFDVYTVTFNHNLKHNMNSKADSMVLAPDSLSTVLDVKSHGENDLNECQIKDGEKNKILSKSVGVKSSKTVESNYQGHKTAHKRLSSETLNESRPKKCNKVDISGSNQEISKTEDNISGITVPKIILSEPSKISENVEDRAASVLSKKDIQLSKKKCTETKITPLKDNENEINLKNSTLLNNLISDVKNKNISNQTSPSLVSAEVNVLPKIIDLDPSSNDDDFLEQNSISKVYYSEDSWDTCDKKKLLKKPRNVKLIKSTSKYKMTLDAPPLNYKKPTYKQTKLSKSIFQSKSSDSNKKSPQKVKLSKNDLYSVRLEDDFSAVLQDHLQPSTPVDNISPVVDIDATFIPDDFKLESPLYNTTKVKKNTVKNLNLKNGNLFSNISFPEEVHLSIKKMENSCIIEEEITDSLDDVELKENMNSFDRLPMPEEPTYKYKNDVVRKKAERRQLNGFDCKECEKYYSELGLTAKEKKERMKKCSRHRGKYTPPATPDHFWELDFPDTEECKARGYLNETQKVNLNNICNI